MPCLLLAHFAVQMGAERRQRLETHTSAPELKVEHLVMRSMCAELIRGQIDEAETEAFQPLLLCLKLLKSKQVKAELCSQSCARTSR